MKLNTDKIFKELDRLGQTQSWLAEKAGISRQLLNYLLKKQSLKGAEKIGGALDIEPRDLIRSNK